MPRKVPAYRHRKDCGQAVVTLSDSRTKARRDYWLGPHGTPASRELYHRLIAEWESNGRVLPSRPGELSAPSDGQVTVSEIIHGYWQHIQTAVCDGEAKCVRVACRLLKQFFGQTPAAEFGPKKLRQLRERMTAGDSSATPPRIPWSRTYTNQHVKRIRRMFKWAAAQELLPVTVYQQLSTIESLRKGRTTARENPPVRSVELELVETVRPYVSRQVAALMDLQLLTGARGGELLKLRRIDLNMDAKSGIWTYSPIEHKTAYCNIQRVIFFGPRAQEVIRPFLENRPDDAYLFSPAEADAERRQRRHEDRKTAMSCGNRPGTHRAAAPLRKPGPHYTRRSYYSAVQYACAKAFPPPAHLQPRILPNGGRESRAQFLARLTDAEKAELHAWRKAHRWHPHQLRHAAASNIRRQFGLEAAQLVLGHSSAVLTDAVYAERDAAKVIEVVKERG